MSNRDESWERYKAAFPDKAEIYEELAKVPNRFLSERFFLTHTLGMGDKRADAAIHRKMKDPPGTERFYLCGGNYLSFLNTLSPEEQEYFIEENERMWAVENPAKLKRETPPEQ